MLAWLGASPMRQSCQITTRLAVAMLASTAAAAPLRAQALPPSPHVNLRLNPDLCEAMTEIRAALLGQKAVRIAEPADYELTTKKDFPLTLIAVDARQPADD